MDTPTAKNSIATLCGGIDYTATKRDGSSETVQILQLPIKQFPAYSKVLTDEPALVDLLTGKPKGWSETLTNESFEQIVQEGKKLNADFFERWLRRQFETQEKLTPGITQAMV